MTSPPINTHCPWSSEPISLDSTTLYRGSTVAFCNPGCRDKFEKAATHFDECIDAGGGGPMKAGFARLAGYNRWMNNNLVRAAIRLPSDALWQDRGAFFGSIMGTFNHLLVWDITWLQRFEKVFGYESLGDVAAIASPTAHDQILYKDIDAFAAARQMIDETVISFVSETRDRDFPQTLTYTISTGATFRKNFGGMLQHLFNHQTHHRGQITTLLRQSGIDPGVTDLLALLPEEDEF